MPQRAGYSSRSGSAATRKHHMMRTSTWIRPGTRHPNDTASYSLGGHMCPPPPPCIRRRNSPSPSAASSRSLFPAERRRYWAYTAPANPQRPERSRLRTPSSQGHIGDTRSAPSFPTSSPGPGGNHRRSGRDRPQPSERSLCRARARRSAVSQRCRQQHCSLLGTSRSLIWGTIRSMRCMRPAYSPTT